MAFLSVVFFMTSAGVVSCRLHCGNHMCF